MGQPSFFDNVREWIGGIAFAIYLWSVKMSDEEFWNEQERQAVQHLRALDEAYPYPGSPYCPHKRFWGECCSLPESPHQ